jgi:anti-sigma28 factor (negative regulator of flagellin synthesis)
MNAWTAHGASGGASNTDMERDQRPLDREDQTAIELGFPPPGGLTWRRRRVHQLREGIESGSYEVDPGRVAEAMLARLREAS